MSEEEEEPQWQPCQAVYHGDGTWREGIACEKTAETFLVRFIGHADQEPQETEAQDVHLLRQQATRSPASDAFPGSSKYPRVSVEDLFRSFTVSSEPANTSSPKLAPTPPLTSVNTASPKLSPPTPPLSSSSLTLLDKEYPLHDACARGEMDKIRHFIETKKMDVNERGHPPQRWVSSALLGVCWEGGDRKIPHRESGGHVVAGRGRLDCAAPCLDQGQQLFVCSARG
ncbi:hypothetical protein GUITHDRAFT_87621 [Guillardia theta CCMP2712]|uniref:Uncharacterized protein n=1 Tax=Guillardia theta (strain CCMP2712) TaxID=905079 RepID=L1J6R1_GUITC|nr:hypothetical protein GUITHDRAFT_87621 [Guillardia theta CCMP2712]EKX44027.1 hypothetical protein GUITHDRAFT_87621 [Guillardia theta CCMP2712]|eukprot:XP_005831007.1 hypothetical protein GUITHDRAFT_87621 [Guillardia theta CCMP2712]